MKKLSYILLLFVLIGCAHNSTSEYYESIHKARGIDGSLIRDTKIKIDESCKKGNIKDCEYLADYYDEQKDIHNMLKYAKIACSNGSERACGIIRHNSQKAKEAKRKASVLTSSEFKTQSYKCNNGDSRACNILSVHYLSSNNMVLDNGTILRMAEVFRIGCFDGGGDGQARSCFALFTLSNTYLLGLETSVKALDKGCSIGDKLSCQYLQVLMFDIKHRNKTI